MDPVGAIEEIGPGTLAAGLITIKCELSAHPIELKVNWFQEYNQLATLNKLYRAHQYFLNSTKLLQP